MQTETQSDWEGERAASWIARSATMEARLAPVLGPLLAAADLHPGERVLDVGCGTGPSAYAAAGAVGLTGHVVGLDISPAMVAVAAERMPAGLDITWVASDAGAYAGDGTPFDVILSRFGVMFLDDPAAAFAHLAALLRPGGRLAAAVWADRREVEMFEVPYVQARAVLDEEGVAYEEVDPFSGPSSLGDPATAIRLLEDSGWHDVHWTPAPMRLPVGAGSPDEVASQALEIGPTRSLLADLEARLPAGRVEELRARIRTRVVAAYDAGALVDGSLAALPAILTARRA